MHITTHASSTLCSICLVATAAGAATLPAELEPRRVTADEGKLYTGTDVDVAVGGLVRGLGDIDGDGRDDIVLGTSSFAERSAQYLLYGDPATHPSVLDPSTIASEGGIYIAGASEIKPIGDFNGDGLDDWLLQSRGADAIIVAGSAAPYPSPFDAFGLGPGGATLLLDTEPAPFGLSEGRSRVHAVGDFTGDGLADLVVLGDIGFEAEQTRLALLPGRPGELPATLEHADASPENVTSVRFGRDDEEGSGIEWSAWDMTVGAGGDLDGDGRDDLLLVSSWSSRPLSRGAYVVFGTPEGLPPLIDFLTLDGDNGFSVLAQLPGGDDTAAIAFPELASIALVRDTDGDGVADLLAATTDSSLLDGQIDILRGAARPWPAVLTLDALTERAAWHLGGTDLMPVGDAGDLNGDGLNDWLVPAAGTAGRHGDAVHVVYGRGAPFEDFSLDDIDGVRGFTLEATLRSDYLDLDRIAPAGDVNGDGADELLVGLPDAAGPLDDLDIALDTEREEFDGAPGTGLAALVLGRVETGAPASPYALYPALAPAFVELRWQVPDGQSPAGFELRRDGELVAEPGIGARRHEDRGAARGVRHTYTAVAVDETGRRSAPLLLSVNNDSAYYPELGGAVHSDTLAELGWVDDREFESGSIIRLYTIYRDGLEVDGRRARSWLDEAYDPAGHVYFVETREESDRPRLNYALRSASLALPEQNGTRPPGPVSELRVELLALDALELSWEPAPWGVPPLGYEVSVDGVAVGTTGDPHFVHTLGSDGQQLVFAVIAVIAVVTVDANGRRSARTTLFTNLHDARQALLPTRADALVVEDVTETSVTLGWEANAVGTPISAWEIAREGAMIALVTERRYTDVGLAPDTAYGYEVTGIDENGRGSESSYLTTVTAGGPFAPASVRALAYSPDTVELSWSRVVGNATCATAYEVYRDGTLIATVDALSLMEYELEPDTEYRYDVRSLAADGRRSADSAGATVRTPPID